MTPKDLEWIISSLTTALRPVVAEIVDDRMREVVGRLHEVAAGELAERVRRKVRQSVDLEVRLVVPKKQRRKR